MKKKSHLPLMERSGLCIFLKNFCCCCCWIQNEKKITSSINGEIWSLYIFLNFCCYFFSFSERRNGFRFHKSFHIWGDSVPIWIFRRQWHQEFYAGIFDLMAYQPLWVI